MSCTLVNILTIVDGSLRRMKVLFFSFLSTVYSHKLSLWLCHDKSNTYLHMYIKGLKIMKIWLIWQQCWYLMIESFTQTWSTFCREMLYTTTAFCDEYIISSDWWLCQCTTQNMMYFYICGMLSNICTKTCLHSKHHTLNPTVCKTPILTLCLFLLTNIAHFL